MTKTNEILTNYLDNVQISTETAEATGEAMAEGFTQAAEANAPNTSNVIDWGDAVTGYFVDTAKDASANWMQSNGYGKYVDTAKAAQDAVTDNGLSGTSDSGIFGYGLNIEYMEVLTSDPTKTAGDIIRNVEYEANKLTGSTSLFGGWSGQ